jgi:hypothetical protein
MMGMTSTVLYTSQYDRELAALWRRQKVVLFGWPQFTLKKCSQSRILKLLYSPPTLSIVSRIMSLQQQESMAKRKNNVLSPTTRRISTGNNIKLSEGKKSQYRLAPATSRSNNEQEEGNLGDKSQTLTPVIEKNEECCNRRWWPHNWRAFAAAQETTLSQRQSRDQIDSLFLDSWEQLDRNLQSCSLLTKKDAEP